MTEGERKSCSRCKTEIIHVKITKSFQGKSEEKLQWQNKEDNKPHFYFAGEGKYNCSPPTADGPPEPTQEKPKVDTTIKVKDPFQEAELIARWAGEKAYKIVMADVHDFSKLTPQEKSGLGQKEGMYTRLLADTVIDLMKLHGVKTNYE